LLNALYFSAAGFRPEIDILIETDIHELRAEALQPL
jgi:hypothetical protein